MPDWSHTRLYRAVHGAVVNTLHGHPDWSVPKDFARSVAKRAAGTLAGMTPGEASAAARRSGRRRVSEVARRLGVVKTAIVTSTDGGEGRATPLSLCRALLNDIAHDAHKRGDDGLFIQACAAARIVKEMQKCGR